MLITRAQRVALKRVYDRAPLFYRPGEGGAGGAMKSTPLFSDQAPLTYRAFREQVIQFDYSAIGLQWCGMWLGIETDGCTHS